MKKPLLYGVTVGCCVGCGSAAGTAGTFDTTSVEVGGNTSTGGVAGAPGAGGSTWGGAPGITSHASLSTVGGVSGVGGLILGGAHGPAIGPSQPQPPHSDHGADAGIYLQNGKRHCTDEPLLVEGLKGAQIYNDNRYGILLSEGSYPGNEHEGYDPYTSGDPGYGMALYLDIAGSTVPGPHPALAVLIGVTDLFSTGITSARQRLWFSARYNPMVNVQGGLTAFPNLPEGQTFFYERVTHQRASELLAENPRRKFSRKTT